MKLKIVIAFLFLVLIFNSLSFSADNKELELTKTLLQERLARLQAEFVLTQEQLKQVEMQLKIENDKKSQKQEVVK